jgi:hypothetical protein
VALELYLEVSLELADSLEISSEGFGAGLFDNEDHLAVQVAASILGHKNFKPCTSIQKYRCPEGSVRRRR